MRTVIAPGRAGESRRAQVHDREGKMKKLIIFVLALALLQIGDGMAAGGHKKDKKIKPQKPITEDIDVYANGQVCKEKGKKDEDGIFLLEFRENGSIRAFRCKGKDGKTKEVKYKTVNTKVGEILIEVRKFTDPKNPEDPCYEYEIDGEVRAICW
jgi:hypothetical protein